MSIFQKSIPLNVLVVGASRGIGLGFVKQLLQLQNQINSQFSLLSLQQIYATYRHQNSAQELFNLKEQELDKLICLPMDITDESSIISGIEQISQETKKIHLVIYCVGILHDRDLQPEKSLKQINSENLIRYFQVNSIGAILLAKHIMPLLRHQENSMFAAISAKVGSIGDNHLGGWYGYRASKTALNMFLKTISIEYSRRCPKTIIVALHPGTTDTNLSQPFQKNVTPEKLFSVSKTVNQLLEVMANLELKNSGEFFSWDGTPLPW
jgi:NAD(P)-dependent dehydrogenase (short-subunit alcohol dehydrogenase family)